VVAAAAIGSAAIGAAGSAVAGSEAASATQNATNAAIQEQSTALGQQANLSLPYRQLGQSAIPQLQSLLGIGTPGQGIQPSIGSIQTALAQTPGYQFTQQQGTQNTLNAASAQGLALSGNTLQGLSQFNAGLADQTYQQAVGNLQNTVNTGQAAAAGQAVNVGNAANNISSALINQGNTLAGIDANTVAGLTKSVGNAYNNYTTNQTLSNLDTVDPTYAYSGEASPGAGAGTVSAGGGYTFNAPSPY
jgi:hypothetical protein